MAIFSSKLLVYQTGHISGVSWTLASPERLESDEFKNRSLAVMARDMVISEKGVCVCIYCIHLYAVALKMVI